MHALRDVGLGTAFERWAIYDRLGKWFGAHPPSSALEGPLDGMAGMPGLHLLPLARLGTQVTVVLAEAEARHSVETVYRRAGLLDRLRLLERVPEEDFELVLAFNVASLVEDWRATVESLAARTRRHLLLFATHPRSYGVGVRRLVRRFEPGPRRQELFDHEGAQPEEVRACLERHGAITAEVFVDCPWWPDLFVDAGETLVGSTVARLTGRTAVRHTAYDMTPDTFWFAASNVPPEIERVLRRHPHFDGRPAGISGWFAHHRAYLLDRSNVDLRRAAEYP